MGGALNYTIITFVALLIILIICAAINITIKNNVDIRVIDKMSGEEFEKLLGDYFKDRGYKVTLTPRSNDYGADLVLSKNRIRTIIQAKRYKNKVNNRAVQEIVSAKSVYNADKCMVVTNSYYTKNAIKLAKANDVILWDRDKLKQIL